MKPFVFSTISSSLLEVLNESPTRIRMFNFSDRTQNIRLDKERVKDTIGAFDATWVRIYTDKNLYYDFLASNVFFISNSEGVILLCSEDTKLIDSNLFAAEINNLILEDKEQVSSRKMYLNKYNAKIAEESKEAYKKLIEHYSLQRQFKSGRIEIDNSYTNAKNNLTLKYLKDLIFKKQLKENREIILEKIS